MNRFLFLPVLGAVTMVANAELPPKVYEDLQAKSPEILRIKVDEVVSKPEGLFKRSEWNETVTATVDGIVRTKSGVKVAEKITITYSRVVPKGGFVGPAPAPQLQQGKTYTAFLAKTEAGTFSITAKGRSFQLIKEDS